MEPFDRDLAERLVARVKDGDLERCRQLLRDLARDGVTVVTVLDDGYPRNLRLVYNRPPMLFIRGQLQPEDDCAFAVVGTRSPSTAGLEQARELATGLARHGLTVLSGLALGIDSAAHAAALNAGGRTVAVMGTGINRIYPSTNKPLADRIASQGALVSQFWPDAPPTKISFPMRNAVMSGMAIGTVVVEATSMSGAKNQARQALDHGKRLFLVESLVLKQSWARTYARLPGTTVIKSVDELLKAVRVVDRPAKQLAFG